MRILLVCESSHLYESGGRVVRYITKLLKQHDNIVKIVVLSEKRDDYNLGSFYKENDVEFLPVRKKIIYRILRFIYNTEEINKFSNLLNTFKPDAIHFASLDHNKPSKFISLATKTKAQVVMQPWTMHFYCSQGFGFRNGKQCTLCASGNYFNAISKRCISIRGIPSLFEKWAVHRNALKANLFLSTNVEFDEILNKYGVKKSNIFRFPVPFDYTFLDKNGEKTDDYFIFYGQANSHKGLTVLIEVFKKLPEQRLRIYPMEPLPKNFTSLNNVEIINGVNWKNGLADAIINSKAVLLPSLWSTTIEYALWEALQIKKAVILFNVGAHKEIFKNRLNAMVIKPYDLDSFVNAIIEIDKNDELRAILEENGNVTLLEINNPSKLYTQLMECYTAQ
ncbi:glycosyltransferase family 4 protein [Pedobacter puniceum]|uniref:Glycosyltransferase n=1 Tax=Pedobacter puniceum TaxID=2666136 RepID=A0A7K0FT49_9SPHI|nr:glycosyltransferase family 4 protein [Pedobacter puniceum]MRX48655.1 glycosyltransferase [Pedobacter puniceum]